MKIYLVGGAVRDELLGLPVVERDWVVVGATPDALLALGYRQVGRDFPVFLHPTTHEEYALARTERKQGVGYHGFVCDASADVSLPQDLARRDLTINAIARDADGALIDPYHGLDDLASKHLKHVSPAFVEDPLRVLRVARFMARFASLGFSIHQQTRCLMQLMVQRGELSHLVVERVWQEWQRALSAPTPAAFLQALRSCGALAAVLPELDALFGVPYQAQGRRSDSGVHLLATLTAVAGLCADPKQRFAACVWRLGRALTPMHKWPLHPDESFLTLQVLEPLCERLRIPTEYALHAKRVSQFYDTITRLPYLTAAEVVEVFVAHDVLRRPQVFAEVLTGVHALATAHDQAAYSSAWQQLLEQYKAIKPPKELIGSAISAWLIQQRLRVIDKQLKVWKNDETSSPFNMD